MKGSMPFIVYPTVTAVCFTNATAACKGVKPSFSRAFGFAPGAKQLPVIVGVTVWKIYFMRIFLGSTNRNSLPSVQTPPPDCRNTKAHLQNLTFNIGTD